jgi:chemotaxis protein histidine kinase CheA
MSSAQEQFRQFIAQQRLDYQRALPEKLASLQTLWAAVAAGVAPAALGELERLAHTLGGTAGTLGLREVGAAARELELLLTQAREGGAPLTVAQHEDISLALDTLLACPRG